MKLIMAIIRPEKLAAVQAAMEEVRPTLPPGGDMEARLLDTSAFPIVGIAVTSRERSLAQISDFVIYEAAPRFRTLPGVYRVELSGAKIREYALTVDPVALVQHRLDLASVGEAVRRAISSWTIAGGGVEVKTSQGSYTAKHLVVCAGSWVREFIAELPVSLERQSLVWFGHDAPELFSPDHCPIYICEYAAGRFFYGFPDLGNGVKVARHHEGISVDPNSANREVALEEIGALYELARPFLPKLSPRALKATACIYTNMPDEHFLIDHHPESDQVLVCSPCSGHGFKFSSVVGEIAADLLLNGRSRFDLTPFRWR